LQKHDARLQISSKLDQMKNSKISYDAKCCGSQMPADASPLEDGFERLLDSVEAAGLLKIHPKTLQKLARNGEVAAIQIGKLWRFRASALNRWLEKIAN
jgi:excisionase family DNA binding protein